MSLEKRKFLNHLNKFSARSNVTVESATTKFSTCPIQFKTFVFLMLWAACSAHCNGTSSACRQMAIYNSQLDSAIDMIVGSKYALPKVPTDWIPKASDCADVFQMGGKKSGIYEIWPVSRLTNGKISLSVYCDMDTDGGGWTVIQRRGDFQRSKDYFYKDWKSYKEGFGDIEKDFWIGNDNIFALTNQNLYQVRFDLKDSEQNKKHALYDTFWIDDEDHKYTLHISHHSGDAADSMKRHNNQAFTTKDQDNDGSEKSNCALIYKGGWWYRSCHYVNLNGLYDKGDLQKAAIGIYWSKFKDVKVSLSWTEIKIRPKNVRSSLTSEVKYNP